MKSKLIILIAIALSSCTKEYECTQMFNSTWVDLRNGAKTKVSHKFETKMKGSRKEMLDYEKRQTFNTLLNDGDRIILGTCVMKCK